MRALRFTLCISLIVLFFTASSSPQAVMEVDGPGVPIRHGFKTYSLFLICNPQWIAQSSDSAVAALYNQFKVFGKTIGDDNLAVWFWKEPGVGTRFPPVASEIDFGRSINFCKRWKLAPSKGPYIVITPQYPDELQRAKGLPEGSGIFALGNSTTEDTDKLLLGLSDQLLLTDKVTLPTAPPATDGTATPPKPVPPPMPWGPRLLDAVQAAVNQFGCEWTFKLQSGPVDATVHACVTQSKG